VAITGPSAHAVQAPALPAGGVDALTTALLFIAVALLPFQDSPLAKLGFGSFGASLSVLPMVLLAGLWVLRGLARPELVVVSQRTLLVLTYIGAVTLFGLLHFDWQYRGASLLAKAAFAAAHWSFIGVGVAAGFACPRDVLRAAVRIAIVINTLGYVLHANVVAAADGHVIGFSSEPSHFGVLTMCLGMLGAYLAGSNRERYLILGVTLALALGSGSKGALACLALAALAVTILRPHRGGARRFALYVAVLVFAAGLIVVAFLRLQAGLQEFASVATRSSSAITALRLGLQYPFGVGLGGFFPAFTEAIPGSWRLITSYLGVSVNMSEVFAFAYTDDRNLSAKTFFLDTLIYFGWPGCIAAVVFMARLSLKWLRVPLEGSLWLAVGLVFASLAMASYYTVMPFYIVPVLVGFAVRERSRA
jgi:hypothetical protein